MDDEGIKNVEGMAELSKLYLRDTQVSDDGLKSLSSLHQLTELDLHGTRVTDRGLAQLKELAQLRRLNLLGTQVTDTGLENLLGMSQLEELVLYRTQVTNAGLEKLKQLKHLTSLDLRYTRTTRAGVASLQTALPDCGLTSSILHCGPRKWRQRNLPVGKGEKAAAEWIQLMGGKVVWAEGSIQNISLASTSITDSQLEVLGELPNLRELRPEKHRDWRPGHPVLLTRRKTGRVVARAVR